MWYGCKGWKSAKNKMCKSYRKSNNFLVFGSQQKAKLKFYYSLLL